MSEALYRIVANRNCRTHKEGTLIDYTGPRSNVPKGWTIVGKYVGGYFQPDGHYVYYR